jgi:hypothetical protein
MAKVKASFKFGSESTSSAKDELFSVEEQPFTIDDYVRSLQTNVEAYYAENYESLKAPKFGFTIGPKFYRVYREDGSGGRSVHSFVEISTGHVYKADGWKKPAKGVRYTSMKDAAAAADKSGNTGFLYQK